jgi:hypothetical protein
MLKLSPGQTGDAPQGRELLQAGGPAPPGCYLIMDRAYEGDETLGLARQLGYTPVVPPNPNRLAPWVVNDNHCFLPVSTNSTCYFLASSSWRSLLKLYELVLTGPRAVQVDSWPFKTWFFAKLLTNRHFMRLQYLWNCSKHTKGTQND